MVFLGGDQKPKNISCSFFAFKALFCSQKMYMFENTCPINKKKQKYATPRMFFRLSGRAFVSASPAGIMSNRWSSHPHWDSHDDRSRGGWSYAGSSSDSWRDNWIPGDNNRSGGSWWDDSHWGGGTADMGGKGELCPQLRPRSRPQLRCLGLLHLSLSRPQLRFQAVAVAMTWLRLARHQRGQPSSNALWRLVLR